jgi:hypothetical protein
MSVTRFYGGESSLDFRSLVGDCLTRAANRRRGEGRFGVEGARVAACPGPDVHPRASIVVQELVMAG